ncbi:hypothetical protein ACOQFV_20580 [Nocardiopsis changdeensis]|uniref:DUF3052 domain-containing protein n=1 Tax=Nocardiopsis changdeensis TaxID=2831969 RepID=A0ABX8BTX4_9ACTN|nr:MULTISPECIES: hypothetical protein [Nocardiopsis]QUX25526.1 hypothetical protein KGD84_15565 [Nocardiopsis changdeensis]QYX35912.1 hypothetical protein K1J57_25020 [Nocardiopsis sp. MT53]
MSETLAHRLGVRAGDRLLVLNAPERYLRLLEPPPDTHIDLGPIEGAEYDSVHLFALDRATVDREVHPVLKTLSPAAAVWVCYPQPGGTIITDLRSDRGWDVLVDDGWRPAAQVPIDSDWAALRFTRG